MIKRRVWLAGMIAVLTGCGEDVLKDYARRIEDAAAATPGVSKVRRVSYSGTEISRSVLVDVQSTSGDEPAMVATLEALIRNVVPVLDEPRQSGARIRFVVVSPTDESHFVTTKALGMGDSSTFKEVRERFGN